MRKFIVWTIMKLLFPLMPFFISAFIRYIYFVNFSVDIFKGRELSFSIVILFIFAIDSIEGLNNIELRKDLIKIYLFCIIISLILFITQTSIDLEINKILFGKINIFKSLLESKTNLIGSINNIIYDSEFYRKVNIQEDLNLISIAFSFLSIFLIIICKIMYKLED